MSWVSENYEKAAIGGASVVALALGFLAFKSQGDSSKAYEREPVSKKNDTEIPGKDRMGEIKKSLSVEHIIHERNINGRKVNLLTGVPLYIRKGELKKPVDLMNSENVHNGMKNQWFADNDIDIGFSDSPDRDPDNEGFSNREEYEAGTDPKSASSHPDPISKLALVSVKSVRHHLKPTDFGAGRHKFKLLNQRGIDKDKMGQDPIEKGTVIPFTKDYMPERFKFVGTETKKDPNGGREGTIWLIEDLAENKKGKIYRIDRRANPGIVDSTATFTLNALGQDGSKFTIPE
ncbi:MAG: Amuc_1099 family pilus-like system protein, partial [Akkermansiaceae bacterium]